jgi:IPT/TIG domain
MSTQITSSKASSTPTADIPPGQQPMGAAWIASIAIYLVLLSVLVLYGLLKIWPHQTTSAALPTGAQAVSTASPGASPAPTSSPESNGRTELPEQPETIYFVGGRLQATIYAETRLLLIVILGGALGSLLHTLRSLYWYTGNREMVWSWVAFYLLLPFSGAILAVIFYFVVRGGFFSPQASVEFTSPFGFAALSALVGLFSSQATLKLKDVAETIFTKPGAGADAKAQETITVAPAETVAPSDAQQTEPKISSIDPPEGSVSGTEEVTIEGIGFDSNPTVLIGNLPATIISATSTTIKATTPPSGAVGVVDVEVSNASGKKATLSKAFTYVADATTNNNN